MPFRRVNELVVVAVDFRCLPLAQSHHAVQICCQFAEQGAGIPKDLNPDIVPETEINSLRFLATQQREIARIQSPSIPSQASLISSEPYVRS